MRITKAMEAQAKAAEIQINALDAGIAKFKNAWRELILNNHRLSHFDRLVGISIVQAYNGDFGGTCEDLDPQWLAGKMGVSMTDLNRSIFILKQLSMIIEIEQRTAGVSLFQPPTFNRTKAMEINPFK